MNFKQFIAFRYAKIIRNRVLKWSLRPAETQVVVFRKLLEQGRRTKFGRDHNFKSIHSYEEFKNQVPVRDYEGIKEYIELIIDGHKSILWPGRPLYFCKTSGTTSGVKYIPISKDSMPFHIKSAREALLLYILEKQNSNFLKGKMIFVQGSPVLEDLNGIPCGRLSGIVAHHIPKYLQKSRLPSFASNSIDDWEEKIDAIVEETVSQNMTVIGGIPIWLQMYFERLIEKSEQKQIKDIYPNFQLLVLGGVNFEPYSNRFKGLIGKEIDSIEFYPASEGFFAYQDKQQSKGLLLLLNHGIFYEFIEAEHFYNSHPKRICIEDVELNTNYVLIISTNAGLWGYNVGDTIKFVSKDPHRIIVTGRLKHFISAFGEHVIAEEIESALYEALSNRGGQVQEFTIAPQVNPHMVELPFHEWYIEFEELPDNLEAFILELDRAVCMRNPYYNDLILGKVIQPLKISLVQRNGFNHLMKKQGKLGGQNKIARLSNDRYIADALDEYKI